MAEADATIEYFKKREMKALLCFLISCYRTIVSPLLHSITGPGCGCRYEPTCSQYVETAIQEHGVFKGMGLGIKRVFRCHPWGGCGFDPVPARTLADAAYQTKRI
ncbi:MAG: membrane protein insertion efficiency factor YidD [Chthoniobacterales bacterium]